MQPRNRWVALFGARGQVCGIGVHVALSLYLSLALSRSLLLSLSLPLSVYNPTIASRCSERVGVCLLKSPLQLQNLHQDRPAGGEGRGYEPRMSRYRDMLSTDILTRPMAEIAFEALSLYVSAVKRMWHI